MIMSGKVSFARNLFIRPTDDELENHNPEFTIIMYQ